MSDNLARRLHNLCEARELDDIDEAAYQRAITKLRAQYGDDAVDTLLHSDAPTASARNHTLIVTGKAEFAAAGDVHGNIYLYGKRGKTEAQLLEAYLRRIAYTCGTLPLQGVREQKSATDVWNISLEQVYTQLATMSSMQREVFEGEVLRRFDAKRYLEEHTQTHLLPLSTRDRLLLARPTIEVFDYPLPFNEEEEYTILVDIIFDKHISVEELQKYKLYHVQQDSQELTLKAIPSSARDQLSFLGPQLVTEAITANHHLVLLGEPGSGKSTALRYLALTLAKAGLDKTFDLAAHLEGWDKFGEQGRLLPISLPLLPLAKRLAAQPNHTGNADDLWNYLAEHLEANGRAEGLAAAVHSEIEQGRVLLLLDGLDEVAGANSRQQVIQAVQAFTEQYQQCRTVVACRVRAYEGEQNAAWHLPGWPTMTLADWTPGQMEYFIDAWYKEAASASRMPATKRDERAAALKRAVNTREDLQRLGVRPLLLTIMALVHLNDGRLPEDRVSLYSRCLDILLGQWEIGGRDASDYGKLMDYIGLPDTDVKSLRPLLSRAAFTAHEAATPGSLGRLRRAELREMVAETLEALKHPNPYDGAKRFLDYTDIRAGLLQASDAGDAYAFPHQTFQEYLAGLELVRGVDFVQRITDKRTDDRWRVPIFLGIAHTVSEGVLSAPYQLLNRLLRAKGRSEEQRQRDLLFAADLADDIGWDRLERGGEEFSELRADLVQALAVIVEGTALPAVERVKAGVYLGQLGDPRLGVCTLPPAMVKIAAGSTVIGDDLSHPPVNLAAFEIARYPMTNAQYALFTADDGYNWTQPWWDDAGRAWLRQARRSQPLYWHDERFGIVRPNHPVVMVTWYEAVAFCRWLSQHREYNPGGYVYRLPSEAEWEYAARGVERRSFPWGEVEPDNERVNFDEQHNGTTTVGCFASGATPQGVLDLAGNVWEWTGSVYALYPYDPADGREQLDDPSKKHFTLRGGAYYTDAKSIPASLRGHSTPDDHDDNGGFRLARQLPL